MKILVIGACGQIGKAVAAAAGAGGHQVFGADIKSTGAQFALDLADINSVGKVVETVNPQLTALCSAMTYVDGCEKSPDLARQINAKAPGAIASMCLKTGSRLVYLSTEYVFDGKNGPYSETDSPNPISVYGRTKLEGEARVLGAMPDALSIRTTVVYSFDMAGNNFIMQLINSYSRGVEMKVPGDQYSNPTYAPELAGFILELALAGCIGIYNVAGSDRLNRYEFALKASQALGFKKDFLKAVSTAELKQAAPRPLNAGLKMDKLLAALGKAPSGVDKNLRSLAEKIGWTR